MHPHGPQDARPAASIRRICFEHGTESALKEVLAALRAATAQRHESVDRSMPLSRPNPNINDYVEHLRLMRAWLHPLECWLEGSDVYPDSSSPRILQTSLIDADLAEVGLPSEEVGLPSEADACVTKPGRWPARALVSYRWGARYVIEGSRLGAAVLYRRLSNDLRPHNLRYLQGDAGGSTDRWPKFLRDLRASVQTPAEIEAACEGACDSFDALLALRPKKELS